jgi:hypothetical protein
MARTCSGVAKMAFGKGPRSMAGSSGSGAVTSKEGCTHRYCHCKDSPCSEARPTRGVNKTPAEIRTAEAPTSPKVLGLDKTVPMEDVEVLRLVRLRCRVADAQRRGLIVARDVDAAGRVHFVVLQPVSGGRPLKYAVDSYTGKLLEPPVIEP